MESGSNCMGCWPLAADLWLLTHSSGGPCIACRAKYDIRYSSHVQVLKERWHSSLDMISKRHGSRQTVGLDCQACCGVIGRSHQV